MPPHNPAVPDPPGHRWQAARKPSEGYQRVAVKKSARNRKALGLAALIVGLAGVIAAWVLWPKHLPTTAFLTIPIREYDKFPANPFAEQDSELLYKVFPENLRAKEYGKQEGEPLRRTLAGLQARTDEALIIHLRAHGRRDGANVYLLPSDADPGAPDTWLPLSEVLDSVRKCKVPHKLLLLDLMQPIADARLGILKDDVAEGVDKILHEEKTPGLFVLSACAPGQVSLVSEDLQLSVFGYYLEQGLRGWADGYNAGSTRDQRVTVKELAEYVRRHVDRWARQNRGTRQTPVLYGQAQDFPLLGYEENALRPPGDLPGDQPAPDWPEDLWNLWKMRDDWQSVGLYRTVPGPFLQVEAVLLQAEDRWHRGIEISRIQDYMGKRLATAHGLAELGVAQPRQPEPYSLALARGPASAPDPEGMEALRKVLTLAAPKSEAKKEEVDKARAAFQDKLKDRPPAELAAVVFEAAVKDSELTADKVRLLDQILGPPRYVESAYLKRLRELADVTKEFDWPWRLDVVNQLLLTAREGEKAAAADPADLPWVEDALRAADDKRRKGENLLFTKRYDFWDTARTYLKEAETGYNEINANLQVLGQARLARDDALAFLPGYVPYLNRLRDGEAREVKVWEGALNAALDLHQDLVKPDLTRLGGLAEKRLEVRSRLGNVQRAFDQRREHFFEQDKAKIATVNDYADGEALLASPRLTVSERIALWSTERKLAREFLTATRQADAAELNGPPLSPLTGDADLRGTPVGSPEQRARLALGLLDLGGLPEVGGLRQKLAKATSASTEESWRMLADDLYQAWASLPRQLQKAGNDLARLDRLSRLNGLLVEDQPGVRQQTIPQSIQRRQAVEHRWEWLARRLVAESKAAGTATSFGKLCAQAAAEYQP